MSGASHVAGFYWLGYGGSDVLDVPCQVELARHKVFLNKAYKVYKDMRP